MVATLVASGNGTFVPQAGVRFLRVGAESLLPHSSCEFFFYSQRTATARFAPACRSSGSAPLRLPIFPVSVSLRIRGPACAPLPAAILISAWRPHVRASIARRHLPLADSSWPSPLAV